MNKVFHQSKLNFNKFAETFDPEAYGYTWQEFENGDIDIFEEWVKADYGVASGRGKWLLENRETIES